MRPESRRSGRAGRGVLIAVGWALWPEARHRSAGVGAPPGGSTVVFLGDSITHGHRLPADVAFPHRVGQALGIPVVNAGISGRHDRGRAGAPRPGRAGSPPAAGRRRAGRQRRARAVAARAHRRESPDDHAADPRAGRRRDPAAHQPARASPETATAGISRRSPGRRARPWSRISSRGWFPVTPTTGFTRTSRAKPSWPSASCPSSERHSESSPCETGAAPWPSSEPQWPSSS